MESLLVMLFHFSSTGDYEDYEYEYFDWDVMDEQASFFMEEDKEFVKHENFIKFYAKYDRKQRTQLGHKLRSMMMECRWNGRPCSPR